ncbi:MAG TPA: TrkA family potassium uptake protein [Bdellovibrionota bacterium]|nr:TrkA family potassium uptake protein [Bdellovibrionota bacterium]
MPKRILIIGLGRFGFSLAESLAIRKCEVIAIDKDMARVSEIKDRVTYAAQVDGTDVESLRSVKADSVAAAVVGMGDNFEAAMLCVAALKEVGVAQVIARAQTARHARILAAIGASEVLQIEADMGRRLADSIVERPDKPSG